MFLIYCLIIIVTTETIAHISDCVLFGNMIRYTYRIHLSRSPPLIWNRQPIFSLTAVIYIWTPQMYLWIT